MARRASFLLLSATVLIGCGGGGGSSATPALPPVRLTIGGPASVVGGSQATYGATEFASNGSVVSSANVSFSLDSKALGTIDPTSGVLTASTANNATGHVIATDSTAAITAALPIRVLSSRPATAGDSLSYAGTLTRSRVNNAIPTSTTESSTVAQTVVVASTSSGNAVLDTNEADNSKLSTLTTKTISTIHYATSGASTDIRLNESSSTDSNNAIYTTQYTSKSGLLTVEPETPGPFGPNNASEISSETDPGIDVSPSGQNVTTTRTTAANGSYEETTTNADGSTNTASQQVDGSATYAIDSGAIEATYGTANAGAIAITLVVPPPSPNQTPPPPQTLYSPVWYSLPLYTESDSIAAPKRYDSRCNVPAKYGKPSSVVTETISSVDAAFGNLENQTTTAYDVVGVGTVCSIFSDSTLTFYDYSGQEGYTIYVNPTTAPVLTTTTTEVLSLTAGTVGGQPVKTESVERAPLSIGHLAVLAARERFRHVVWETQIARGLRLAQSLRRMKGVR